MERITFTSKANRECIDKEYVVIGKLWQKKGNCRLYLNDGKKDIGYFDTVTDRFELSGSPSNWKDDMMKEVRKYWNKIAKAVE